uniref:Uncharacterized protein n=1 Tax=Glossina palpalis gambiensis TaxID=67801 RepID=A0A1B0AQS0_9MUSC
MCLLLLLLLFFLIFFIIFYLFIYFFYLKRYVAAFVFPSARCVKRSTETRNECYCRSKCVSTSMSAKLKNSNQCLLWETFCFHQNNNMKSARNKIKGNPIYNKTPSNNKNGSCYGICFC